MDLDVPGIDDRYILVLEDEFLILLDLEDQLRAWGFHVLTVATQEVALDAIERFSIAAALVDVHVHGSHTFAVADALSERGIPFVFVTGFSEQEVPEQYRHVSLVSKPYDMADLKVALIAAIRRAKVEPPPGER